MNEIRLSNHRRNHRGELSSPRIQQALDACSAGGGGRVVLGPGSYRCGTLFLRDKVTLHLEAGASILGSPNLADYPAPETSFVDAVGDIRGRALILAERVNEVGLTGEGVIDGNGGAFHQGTPEHTSRPFLVRLVHARGVTIRGLTLRASAAWTVHLLDCEDALVEHVTIDSRVNENNDGIDIDSSRRVTVRDCKIFTDDDAVCLKSTRREACEDIHVHDCELSTECGALKLGTESYGDIRRVRLHDIHIRYAATCAIKVLSSDGGVFEDIEIRNIQIDRTTGPIFVRLGARGRTYAQGDAPKPAGKIRRVRISEVRATVFQPDAPSIQYFTKELIAPEAFSGILITGVPEQLIEDVVVRDCDFSFVGGFQGDASALQPPEQPAMYPEHFYFGVLPGAAAYVRHAHGVVFQDVKTSLQNPDVRPLIVTEDAEGFVATGAF
ncbi:MAG: right-handed parallel beta-helix repeat-containing protein [Burkholderiales bacterium]|nr:right-handed parallel beta-helix repeat-containing protein [Opitutaceae bacterium]